jgi:hypothetical protein
MWPQPRDRCEPDVSEVVYKALRLVRLQFLPGLGKFLANPFEDMGYSVSDAPDPPWEPQIHDEMIGNMID